MPFRAFHSPEGQPRRPLVLIDDSLDDLLVLSFVLSKARIERPVIHFRDPQEAIHYLDTLPSHHPEARPLMILSDLRMPGVNGLELISWIRKQPALREIPIAILTVSEQEDDRQTARKLGVDTFWTKFPAPSVIESFIAKLAHHEVA